MLGYLYNYFKLWGISFHQYLNIRIVINSRRYCCYETKKNTRTLTRILEYSQKELGTYKIWEHTGTEGNVFCATPELNPTESIHLPCLHTYIQFKPRVLSCPDNHFAVYEYILAKQTPQPLPGPTRELCGWCYRPWIKQYTLFLTSPVEDIITKEKTYKSRSPLVLYVQCLW